MMNLRQIRRRIKSVTSTKKITKAMEMVAAAKLKKYQDLLGQTRLYGRELERMLGTLAATTSVQHEFFEKREPKASLILLMSSDQGLCGSYNVNVCQRAEAFVQEPPFEPVSYLCLGKQGAAFARRRGWPVVAEVPVPRPADVRAAVRTLISAATAAFRARTADRVMLCYTEFNSLSSFRPTVAQVLPLQGLPCGAEGATTVPATGERKPCEVEYLLEPSAAEILTSLIPHYLELRIDQALKEAMVTEQVSRMMAMRQATDNAAEMIDNLTLQRNKARQAAITKELLEVVSGARAQQSK